MEATAATVCSPINFLSGWMQPCKALLLQLDELQGLCSAHFMFGPFTNKLLNEQFQSSFTYGFSIDHLKKREESLQESDLCTSDGEVQLCRNSEFGTQP